MWFSTYKARDLIECVLPEVRLKTGIDPTQYFTANSSESLNHVIKLEVEWKESKLPNLIEHLKNIVDKQKSEQEKSVIGRGQWHFTKDYNHLIISEACWFFQMSNETKRRHLNKVFTCKPVQQAAEREAERPALSVSLEDSGIASISKSTGTGSLSQPTPPTDNDENISFKSLQHHQTPSFQLLPETVHRPYICKESQVAPNPFSAVRAMPLSASQVHVSSALSSTSGQVLVGGSGSVFNVYVTAKHINSKC